MNVLEFKLDAFQGPLDLLLYLVKEHKLNINDIEISLLLDQYMEYIDGLEETDFDTAGDFLAMAARLVYIKTCSLLPQAEEAEELKKELQGELIEYSVCKEAADALRKMCVYGEVFVRPPEKLPVNKVFNGSIDLGKLVSAYMGMTAKARRMRPVRAQQFSPIVSARIVSVTSKILHVLKALYKTGVCTMKDLFTDMGEKSARVATFLAILELTKSGRIKLNDENTLITLDRSTSRKRRAAHDKLKTSEPEPQEQADDDDITASEYTEPEPQTLPEIEISHFDETDANEEPAVSDTDTIEILYPPSVRCAYISEQRYSSELRAALPAAAQANENIKTPSKSPAVNRFSKRFYWGYPLTKGNALPYRKERL